MSTEVFFNRPGQPLGIERLYREIRAASVNLTVASAWFTDTHIAQAVIEAPAHIKLVLLNAADLGRGDKRAVAMIKQAAETAWIKWETWSEEMHDAWMNGDDEIPREVTTTWDDFCAEYRGHHPEPKVFRLAVLGSRDFTQGVMHHKFIAIDGQVVWTGSYNFTFNAQRNYENLIRVDDPRIADQFQLEAIACATGKGGDDAHGMVRCPECLKAFYPDEASVVEIDSHGGLLCTECASAPASGLPAFKITK